MLEAVIWERIKPIAQGRAWKVVAQEFHESLDCSWPTALCSRDQARAIGVELEVQALAQRFRRLATKRVSVRALRDKALKAIALPRDSESRKQLVARANTLLTRMMAAEAAQDRRDTSSATCLSHQIGRWAVSCRRVHTGREKPRARPRAVRLGRNASRP